MAKIFHAGELTVVESYADHSPFGAVFEDDGQTGYFYALDTRNPDQSILDALHVYNVEAVRDRERPSQVDIRWSPDQNRVVLLINGYAHAAFNFSLRRGYCRTNYPPTSSWSVAGHSWDDSAADFVNAAT